MMKLTNIILPTQPNNNVKGFSTTESNQNTTYDTTISDSIITSIVPHSHPSPTSTSSPSQTPCPPPSLLLPTLTHPHIHLDKAYLLTSNATHPFASPPCCHSAATTSNLPDYAPLSPKSGEFKEALTLTSQAKQLYTVDDLYLRGKQLLLTSYRQGVTAARCFVEVDHVTGETCVEVGVRLKEEFERYVSGSKVGAGSRREDGRGSESGSGSGSKKRRVNAMRVQLVAFAQDPIFSTEHGEENRRLLEEVLEKYKDDGVIEVLGTTPYVETSRTASVQNIRWAITTALKYNLHLDFHLDYNLNPSVTNNPSELMVWDVIRLLKENNWPTRTTPAPAQPSPTSIPRPKPKSKQKRKKVMLGHCTALTLLTHSSLTRLATTIHTSNLPIYFVGLPTSDIYMQGRPTSTTTSSSNQPSATHSDTTLNTAPDATPLHRPRATLNTLSLINDYGIKACLGVNNVGNAFTPFGTGDLLELAAWGVGIYQGGGEGVAEVLYSCVSFGAREACGLEGEGEDGGNEEEGVGWQDGDGNGNAAGDGRVAADIDQEEAITTEKEKEKEAPEEARRSMGVAREINAGFGVYEGMNISTYGLLQIQNEDSISIQDSDRGWSMSVPARKRVRVRDVLWDVPEVRLRRVIR